MNLKVHDISKRFLRQLQADLYIITSATEKISITYKLENKFKSRNIRK